MNRWALISSDASGHYRSPSPRLEAVAPKTVPADGKISACEMIVFLSYCDMPPACCAGWMFFGLPLDHETPGRNHTLPGVTVKGVAGTVIPVYTHPASTSGVPATGNRSRHDIGRRMPAVPRSSTLIHEALNQFGMIARHITRARMTLA